MPTQETYTNAVLKAKLVTAYDGDDILLKEMAGCSTDWSQALCLFRQIAAAEFFLKIEDYTSDAAVYSYNVMLQIIGLRDLEDVQVDPNAQPPGGITIVTGGASAFDLVYNETDLLDAGDGNWYLPLVDKSKPTPYPALPSDYKPVLVTVNGASFTFTFDVNYSPKRIYGFGGNGGPQTIVVTVVTT